MLLRFSGIEENIILTIVSVDITEQCAKLTEAGIDFWLCFLNGVAGKEHSMDHAIHSAELFSKCKPILVGTGGLTLRNGLGFYGETDYQIVPEHVSAAVEGNCVKADVKAHSVLVLKISK